MTLTKFKILCMVLVILSALAVSTAAFAIDKKDAPLNRITNVKHIDSAQPVDTHAEGKDAEDEPSVVAWWEAKQAGDFKKAESIRAILDQEAGKLWSYPKRDDDPVAFSPRITPPLREDGFHRSPVWGNDVTVTNGTMEGGIYAEYDAGGNLYAARCSTWEAISNGQVMVYKSTDGGANWFFLTGYHTGGSYSFSYPVVLTGSSGKKLYVFSRLSTQNGDLGLYRFTQAGSPDSWYYIKSDADTITYYSVCTDFGTGDHIVVGYQKEENMHKFYTIVSTDYGVTWGNLQYVDGDGFHPDLAFGRDGYVYTAYDHPDGADTDIRFFKHTNYCIGSGGWTDLEFLTNDAFNNSYPKVAALQTLPADGAHAWVAYNHDWSLLAKGDDTLEYHGTPTYYWRSPDGYGDIYFNVRFTPAWTYTLKSAQLMFYSAGSVGSNGVRVYVWNSDGQFPTTKVDSVDVPYGSLQWYPNWTTVEFLFKEPLIVVSDFHIGYVSLVNDSIAILSDDGNQPYSPECRSSEYWGSWGTMCTDWGLGVNFLIRAVVEPAGTGIDLRYAYSTNSGVDWSKDHELANSSEYYETACHLWAKRDAGYLDMNVCYLKYKFQLFPYLEEWSDIYQGHASTADPTYWHNPHKISEHRAAYSQDGRMVCQGVYSGYNPGVLYDGKPFFIGNYVDLFFDNFSWVDVDEDMAEEEQPEGFSLSTNYPNPFNPTTTLHFTVHGPQSTVHSPISTTLEIYNVLGQKVRTLVDEPKWAGSYTVMWDGKDDQGSEVASGVYLYRLRVGDYSQSKKMVLMR